MNMVPIYLHRITAPGRQGNSRLLLKAASQCRQAQIVGSQRHNWSVGKLVEWLEKWKDVNLDTQPTRNKGWAFGDDLT